MKHNKKFHSDLHKIHTSSMVKFFHGPIRNSVTKGSEGLNSFMSPTRHSNKHVPTHLSILFHHKSCLPNDLTLVDVDVFVSFHDHITSGVLPMKMTLLFQKSID